MLRMVVFACLATALCYGQNIDPKDAKILKEQRFNAGDGRTGSAFATEDGQLFREKQMLKATESVNIPTLETMEKCSLSNTPLAKMVLESLKEITSEPLAKKLHLSILSLIKLHLLLHLLLHLSSGIMITKKL